jgi:iron complex transport system substrate-binding protein
MITTSIAKKTKLTRLAKMQRIMSLLFVSFAGFVFFVANSSHPLQAIAATGQSKASRIVSVIPAVTEMLFAIGAGPQVVGVGSFDEYPPEVRTLPRVGALLDPDLERILALRPDLVVVYESQTDFRRQLERASVPTFVYKHAGLADVTQTIAALGSRIGRETEAAAVVRTIDSKLKDIRTRVQGRPRPNALVVFGRDALALRGIYASGGVGFLSDMLDAAGGTNVFADVAKQSVQATTELILARRPDVIIELRPQAMTPEALKHEVNAWQGLAGVPAVRNGRVVIVADQRTVVPGPRLAEGTELLARALHPDAFSK